MAIYIRENVVANHIAFHLSDAIHVSKNQKQKKLKSWLKIVIQDGFFIG